MQMPTHLSTVSDVVDWLVTYLSTNLNLQTDNIDVNQRFTHYSIDSISGQALLTALSDVLKRPLSPTVIWQYPTIQSLAEHLAGNTQPQITTSPELPAFRHEPQAVVGMACRLPQAPTLQAFWELIKHGGDAVTEIPRWRWARDHYYHPDRTAPGKMNTRWGAFLEDVDRFDADFFGISPREAIQMDPQQRLMLELACEAIEDAGLPLDALRDSQGGVFVGAMWRDYTRLWGDDKTHIEQHTATGQDSSIISARISYTLGLQGPSLTVNTACSSSLVALHLANQSLRLGESAFALVGGVNLVLSPDSTIAMSKFGGMAPDGRCKAFSAAANGYVRGEGGGMLILKPLSRAIEDGNRIYALIRGSAVNNDGFSNGLTAPNPGAQEAVLRRAYADARVSPQAVHYVEAHGTGTALGDPIEVNALGTVLGAGRDKSHPLRVGSVKTNIGHLEAAAGVAGLIKVCLSMQERTLPPSINCTELSPLIPFDALNVHVQRELEAWPQPDESMLAGVSSFGFGGTNAHVVVQAHEPVPPPKKPTATAQLSDKVAFVFSGNGSQWLGMGRGLLHHPVCRAQLDLCDEAIRPLTGWSLLDELRADEAYSQLQRMSISQPALFAVQVAVAAYLRAHGVHPAAVIGHSVGEVAAAHVAGILSLSDAAHVVVTRSRLQEERAGYGGMLVVSLPPDEVTPLLAEFGDSVEITGLNGPHSTVIGGPADQMPSIMEQLQHSGITTHRVNVDIAMHTRQMDPLVPRLVQSIAGLEPQRGFIPLFSSALVQELTGLECNPDYWGQNLRLATRFHPALVLMLTQGYRHFLEISPHPIMSRPVHETLAAQDVTGVVLGTLRRESDEVRDLETTLEQLDAAGLRPPAAAPDPSPSLIPLSAHVPQALDDLTAALSTDVDAHPDTDVSDLGFTAALRRTHYNQRLAVVASTAADLTARLRQHHAGDVVPHLHRGERVPGQPHRIVFVFSGQGGQWVGMGRELITHDRVFADAIARIDRALTGHVEWSLREQLTRDDNRLAEIDVIQPTLFAVQVALAERWRTWGITPAAVIGHSMGEVAACHVAGVLTLDDALRIICFRSQLLRRIRGQGAMALVALEAASIEPFLTEHIALAASNSPHATVLSGQPDEIAQVVQALETEGIFARQIEVDVASHSPQVDPLRAELLAGLSHIAPRAGKLPVYSTVVAAPHPGTNFDARYWVDNLRQPVQFAPAVEQLIHAGHNIFLEVGPHPTLAQALESTLDHIGKPGQVLPSLRRDEPQREALLGTLGALYSRGVSLNWRTIYEQGGTFRRLPLYPWQRERYWPETASVDNAELLYEIEWQAVESAPAATSESMWLVLADKTTDLAKALADLASEKGVKCVFVSFDEVDYLPALLDTYAPDLMVHLWSLEAESLERAQTLGVESLLRLVKTLETVAVRPRLWLVTRGAQAVRPGDACPGLAQSPLWGMGRALASEQPDLWGGLIDLDAAAKPAQHAAHLLDWLNAATAEDQLALRDGQAYAARLVHAASRVEAAGQFSVHDDASYLITGGLGELGLHLADWLAAHGAKHLILMSRRVRNQHRIQALEARGVTVQVATVDVADAASLLAFFDSLTMPPLRGVIHAAGVMEDGFLATYNATLLHTVMRPKVTGTWALHQLTQSLDLDFFVLFSSFSTLLNSPGLGGYAAANAYLDALAHHRRANGLPALSVNWGFWGEVGMAAQRGWTQNTFSSNTALDLLGQLLTTDTTQIGVMNIDWASWVAERPDAGAAPLLQRLVSLPKAAEPTVSRLDITAIPVSERAATFQTLVREAIAAVLKLPATRIEPDKAFSSLGFDSLMTLELRNRLQAALDVRIPASVLWNYATVDRLSQYLVERLYETQPDTQPDNPPDDDASDLSEDDLLALLAQELSD